MKVWIIRSVLLTAARVASSRGHGAEATIGDGFATAIRCSGRRFPGKAQHVLLRAVAAYRLRVACAMLTISDKNITAIRMVAARVLLDGARCRRAVSRGVCVSTLVKGTACCTTDVGGNTAILSREPLTRSISRSSTAKGTSEYGCPNILLPAVAVCWSIKS